MPDHAQAADQDHARAPPRVRGSMPSESEGPLKVRGAHPAAPGPCRTMPRPHTRVKGTPFWSEGQTRLSRGAACVKRQADQEPRPGPDRCAAKMWGLSGLCLWGAGANSADFGPGSGVASGKRYHSRKAQCGRSARPAERGINGSPGHEVSCVWLPLFSFQWSVRSLTAKLQWQNPF